MPLIKYVQTHILNQFETISLAINLLLPINLFRRGVFVFIGFTHVINLDCNVFKYILYQYKSLKTQINKRNVCNETAKPYKLINQSKKPFKMFLKNDIYGKYDTSNLMFHSCDLIWSIWKRRWWFCKNIFRVSPHPYSKKEKNELTLSTNIVSVNNSPICVIWKSTSHTFAPVKVLH